MTGQNEQTMAQVAMYGGMHNITQYTGGGTKRLEQTSMFNALAFS